MFDDILRIIAQCQGAFVLGITIVILSYYLTLPKKEKSLMWHIILISMSYLLITICTMITAYSGVFMGIGTSATLWKICVTSGYAFGDVSLLTMLRRIAKKNIANRNKSSHNA